MPDNHKNHPDAVTDFASDEISSVKYPRVKLSVGADGSATDLPSTALTNGMAKPSTTPTVGAVLMGNNINDSNLYMAEVYDHSTDGASQFFRGVMTHARQYLFNGSSWDRALGDTAAGMWARPRQLTTYSAAYRLAIAASQLSLTFTFSTNTDKQLATIYHAASATKTVRIRKISILPSVGAAGVFGFEVRRLSATTAPATGNPAITPLAHNPAAAAAEATCLALPTTAGSDAASNSPIIHVEWNAAAATAETNPNINGREVLLFDSERPGAEVEPLIMRSGTAEGYAVVGRSTTAVALRFTVQIIFTEL